MSYLHTNQIFSEDPNPNGSPVVLLIHGLGSDHSSWIFQAQALIEKGYRPITIDLPGFGKSKGRHFHWSLEHCCDSCIHVLDEKSISKAIVCGLSLGGVIAQLMTLNYPERVEALILINTFACLRPKQLDEWAYLLKRFFISLLFGKDKQAELVAERLFPADENELYRQEVISQIKEADRDIYKKAMEAIAVLDLRKRIPSIQCKTLVITAELDSTVPPRNQIEMANLIKSARQVFIPDSRHAVIIDQPDLTNREIIDFITG